MWSKYPASLQNAQFETNPAPASTCFPSSLHPNTTVRDYILISLLTGARRSNVLAMSWDEVNLERGEWRIPETKNGTPQSVPLVSDAIEVLKMRKGSAACADSRFVFPESGDTGHLVEPKKAWKIILDKAGIADLRLHDLRRTMGSWQAGTGANLSVIGRSLNHKSTATTAIYARLWLTPVKNSMETAATAMLQAGGLDRAPDSGTETMSPPTAKPCNDRPAMTTSGATRRTIPHALVR